MKRLMLTALAALAACAPAADTPAAGGGADATPPAAPTERPPREDGSGIAFATIYDSPAGRRLFREVVTPLKEEGLEVVVTVLAARPADTLPEVFARCLGGEAGTAFRHAVLNLEELPPTESAEEFYRALAPAGADAGLDEFLAAPDTDNEVELDRIAIIRSKAPSLEFPGPDGIQRASRLPFLAIGPYRMPSDTSLDLARSALGAIEAGEPPSGARLVVVEGECPGCQVQDFVDQVAGAPDLNVAWVEWRGPGDPLGDWYLQTARPSLLPAIFYEGATLPRGRAAAAFEERNGLTMVQALAMNGIMLMLDTPEIPGGHRHGPEGVPTLHTFEDFECPGCGQFNRQFVPSMERDFVATGRMALSFHHFPLQSIHQYAFGASVAAECAGEQGAFEQYKATLFANQAQGLTGQDLIRYAGQVGLNMEVFQACRDSARASAAVKADMELGVSVGVSGTPSIYLPPYKLSFPTGLSYLDYFLDLLAEGE